MGSCSRESNWGCLGDGSPRAARTVPTVPTVPIPASIPFATREPPGPPWVAPHAFDWAGLDWAGLDLSEAEALLPVLQGGGSRAGGSGAAVGSALLCSTLVLDPCSMLCCGEEGERAGAARADGGPEGQGLRAQGWGWTWAWGEGYD